MVAAGETGGVLDLILSRVADFMEKAAKLKARVISAMIYPERSRNKDLIGFDLQQGRRIELYQQLIEP